MDISSSFASRDSAETLTKQIQLLSNAGVSLIQVRTNEITRAAISLRTAVLANKDKYTEWDIVNGFKEYTLGTVYDLNVKGDGNSDIINAFKMPLDTLGDQSETRFVAYLNPHMFFENNPYLTQMIIHYASILPNTAPRTTLLLLTPDVPMPQNVSNYITTVIMDAPGRNELLDTLHGIFSGAGIQDRLSDEDKNKIAAVGAGMALEEFENYVSLAIIDALQTNDTVTTEDIIKRVSIGKTAIVSKTDLLELYPSESINNVGGMDNLKTWIKKRAACYSDSAREFGVEPPKGLVLLGLPGCGKSLISKTISSILGVPLVRLDFGKMFNSLVGASEERMRTALRQIESMAPVVVLVDELDKGLGGAGGGGDSGTSSRVLGTFLTWLQECTAPVFSVVTLNNVDGLPPELLRRGRFDAIFSTTLPSPEERMDVLRIHLKKRGRDLKKFDQHDRFIELSKGYVPAEIESAVKDGIVNAFSADEKFSMAHVLQALETMVPLSRAFETQIARMEEWASKNATPASAGKTIPSSGRSRVITRKTH